MAFYHIIITSFQSLVPTQFQKMYQKYIYFLKIVRSAIKIPRQINRTVNREADKQKLTIQPNI